MALEFDVNAAFQNGVELAKQGRQVGDNVAYVNRWMLRGHGYGVTLTGEEKARPTKSSPFEWADLALEGHGNSSRILYKDGQEPVFEGEIDPQTVTDTLDAIKRMQHVHDAFKDIFADGNNHGVIIAGNFVPVYNNGIYIESVDSGAINMVHLQQILRGRHGEIAYTFASGHDNKHPGLLLGNNAIEATYGIASMWIVDIETANAQKPTK